MSTTTLAPSRHWAEFAQGVLDTDWHDATARWTPVATAEDEDIDTVVIADLAWVAEYGVYAEGGHACLALPGVEDAVLAAGREYTRICREGDR